MATSTTTISGRLLDGQGNAIVSEYVYFKLLQAGADNDVTPNEVYGRGRVEAQTDASGDISVVLWVNGESDIQSIYEVTTKNDRIEPTQVIIPVSATGGTIDISELLISHTVAGSTLQQSTVLADAKAYTDVLAADPSDNASFVAAPWRVDLGFPSAIPSSESILRSDGTKFVVATNFRVDAGTAGSGTEMGTGTANGALAVAEGSNTTASGSSSHSEGSNTTASGNASHSEGSNTTASGASSHAEGFGTTASGTYSHAEGFNTTASANFSSATGRRGKAIHNGARVEADSQDADVSSTTTDQFTARFQNGYVLKGGALTLDTDLAVADGGTGSSTASGARTTLGVAIGTDVQAHDAQLDDIAALTPTDGNVIVGDGVNWVAESGATARTSLGVAIGTDVQAYDAGLASIAGLTTAADKVIYTTASDTYAVTDLTTAGRALLDDTDAAAQRTTLGILSASATLDFPNIASQSSEELTITVTGAAVGDAVQLAAPSTIEANLGWQGYISATNTVTVRVTNETPGAINPASATWGAIVTPLS